MPPPTHESSPAKLTLPAPNTSFFSHPPPAQPNYQKLYIKSLEDRVDSLESIVKNQHLTISQLLQRYAAPSQTPVPTPAPSQVPSQVPMQAPTPTPTSVLAPSPAQISMARPVATTQTTAVIAAQQLPLATAPPPPQHETQYQTPSMSQQHSLASSQLPKPSLQTATLQTASAAPTTKTTKQSATKNKEQSGANERPKKEVIIIGDSTTKDLNGFKLSRKQFHVTAHSLSGCNTDEMMLLTRALCLRKPDTLILHVGTNDLYPKSGRDTESSNKPALSEPEIADRINNIVKDLKREFPGMKVIVSKLIIRTDHGDEGKKKIKNVNSLITKMNIPFIDHSNITPKYLNGSNLHLNINGTIQMGKNITNYLIHHG